ncbi:MAG: NYN domain-containing protein [Chloroflexi bacterium]|nr:NYN domain-containing protein [Chloroflexota bacterium]
MNSNSDQQIAVFIDFENIATAAEQEYGELDITKVVEYLKTRGRLSIKRAYGDWRRFSKYRITLMENAIDLIQLYSYGYSGKNRADIRLAIDAIESLFTHNNIDTFAIISGDSDFSSLITRLREHGKTTLGVGLRTSTSDLLLKACDEFVFYERLTGNQQIISDLDREEAQDLLLKVLRSLENQGQTPILSAALKQAMISQDPGFDEGNFGYGGFREFLEDNAQLLRLDAVNKNLYVSLRQQEETETAPQPLSQAERYRQYLRRIELRVTDWQARRAIIQDFAHLAQDAMQHGRELTLNQAADNLKEQYDTANVLRTRFAIRETLKLIYASGCLDFTGGRGSFATPVVLKIDNPDELARRSEAAYVYKLIEGHMEIDSQQLSLALFESLEHVPYVEDLLRLMADRGVIERHESGYHSLGQDAGLIFNTPALEIARRDIEAYSLPADVTISAAEAHTLFDEGMESRTRDFATSAVKYLQAVKVQMLALDQRETEASLDDFKWYLAGYCSVQAGNYYTQRRYEQAIPYYLAFFSLVYEGEALWDKVKGLINPMLSYYFVTAPNRLHAEFRKRPGHTHPAEISILLSNHPETLVVESWEDLVERLARVNLALVRDLANEVSQTLADKDMKERTLLSLRQIIAQTAPMHVNGQTSPAEAANHVTHDKDHTTHDRAWESTPEVSVEENSPE